MTEPVPAEAITESSDPDGGVPELNPSREARGYHVNAEPASTMAQRGRQGQAGPVPAEGSRYFTPDGWERGKFSQAVTVPVPAEAIVCHSDGCARHGDAPKDNCVECAKAFWTPRLTEPVPAEAITDEERRAIMALRRLAKRWPRTLTLASMDGTLCVIRTGDERFDAPHSTERTEAVIETIYGIPNTGGGW